MKYCLDSCVACIGAATEADSAKADRIRVHFQNALHEPIAPDIFHMEVAHGLTRAERQMRIQPPHGWTAWLNIMADCPQFYSSQVLMPRAYAIASTARIGVYDCRYVALAEREGCELITSDDKLVKNLQPRFPFIVPLSSFP